MQKHRISSAFIYLALITIIIVLLVYSDTVSVTVHDALVLCGSVIIPSLFPYMVLSSLLVSVGSSCEAGCEHYPHTTKRFPHDAAKAVFLGAICGFPVGAKISCELYTAGKISREKAERLIPLSIHPGPAFVVEVIGKYFWGSRTFGLTLYITEIAVASLLARITKQNSPHKKTNTPPAVPKTNLFASFTQSIISAGHSVISVCGFIVFFSLIIRMTSICLTAIGAGGIYPFAAAFLEFTSGTAAASAIGGSVGAFCTGFSIGWSGLSVIAQCASFTSAIGLSLKKTVLYKFVQGWIVGGMSVLWYHLLLSDGICRETAIYFSPVRRYFSFACCILCILSAFFHRSKGKSLVIS